MSGGPMSVDDFPVLMPFARLHYRNVLLAMTMPWHRLADDQASARARGLETMRCGTTWPTDAEVERATDPRPICQACAA